jgi:peptidoglycan hydrolase CwlO-like protein
MSSERNDLNRQLREKKAEVSRLESKISDLTELTAQRDSILTEVGTLNESKVELEEFIATNNTQKQTLTTEIGTLTGQKTELDTYIQTNTPTKETLTNDLVTLQTQKANLKGEIEELESNKSNTESEIDKINHEKSKLDDLIIELRDKFGLYSKDMRDMSLDSITQLKKYSWSAVAAIIGAVALMIILLCILTTSNPFSEKLLKFFYHEPNLRFYSILTIRISISAAFIFLIIIFLNLARGFVSQYIKARNRLTALRVTDFLIGRIQSKKNTVTTDEDKLKVEIERIKEQVTLLNTHIPKIMDLGNSSFDKDSKTKDPIEQLKKMKEILK